MALEFNPYDEDDLEMCSNCGEDEEYDFGLCVSCVEEALDEMENLFQDSQEKSKNHLKIVE